MHVCYNFSVIDSGKSEFINDKVMAMESKIMISETERLILRRYKEEDLQDLFEYLSDKEVVKYEPYKPLTLNETQENLKWRIGTDEMIAVELKDSHKMIGNVYMGKREFEALEIGYVFNRNYWGHGYAAESCKALIKQAFSNGIHRMGRPDPFVWETYCPASKRPTIVRTSPMHSPA